ncbi:Sodium/calcium exchanger family protein / calcium-binding EF hand family protein isoform 1 [Hibiscus syriacus]|uniref:Sodium/calcium exchanger family protein / calcium-binding EF hand family protein isoform 1 n=1 Tax=Hibiscus syriacus TaxID=106335 RepID=A0A6A2ZSZ6_HIBSY|nr:Sodium/calcium exchanger family protein / calcium-binding EF hand family protein isoform 1 [Hibiscus syriacus]
MKRLGLWDFVHLEFDRELRVDLIAQLIATYNSQYRGSYVNGWRIGVNRADLARALKLSVKKDRDSTVDIEESKESVDFLEELVSNWVLLHEDTWMMPLEVLNWTKMIKEGHFEKKEELLLEKPEQELEEHNIELSLGGQNNLMNKEGCQEHEKGEEVEMAEERREEKKRSRMNKMNKRSSMKNKMNKRSSMKNKRSSMNTDEQEEQDEEQDEYEDNHGEGFPISPKGDNLDPTNLLEGMETADLPFATGCTFTIILREFLVSRVNAQTVPAVSQACGDSSMHQQVMLHELQRRDSVIEHLQKAKFEEQQKRQMEVYRLERELYLMENLLNGYRKALKETNRAFAEYRACYSLPDEPLYKDVSGSGD